MTDFYGDYGWRGLDYIMRILRNDPYIKSLCHDRVYNQHISTVLDPIYPLITLARQGLGGDASLDQIDQGFIQLDIYSRNSNFECHQINSTQLQLTTYQNIYGVHTTPPSLRAGVRKLLHNQGFAYPEVVIELLTEVYVSDARWDSISRTHAITVRYQYIFAGVTV